MEGEVDRISYLHDPLLEHILSFLPIKYAVRTSVLSKSWKDLWISHPYVSFDDNQLTDDHTTGLNQESNSNRSIRTTKFINFVDKVLLHRDNDQPNIKKLQLSCRQGIEVSEFARWFRAVLRDGLEEHDLNFARFCEKPFSCLIPCNSLVTLKLNFGAFSGHKFPKSFYFPNLKNMHLNGFILANNFTYQLMKCQNLENLLLYYFMFDSFSQDGFENGYDRQEILPNLLNAQFDCPYAFRGSEDARLFLKNLITVISNAKVLNLSLSVIEYLSIEQKSPDHRPKFNNLKHMKLCLEAYLVIVMNYIFQMAPNLESFHIEFQPYNYGNHDELKLEQLRSSCSCSRLRVIQMSHLNPENNPHLELVQLFFESAGFLEKIIIELDEIATKNPFVQCQKLLELPRPSKSCVLYVKWENGSHTFTLCN